jgi:hypothetical protein
MSREEDTCEILLELLSLYDSFFKGVADVEANGGDLTRLPNAMYSGQGLLFDRWVPDDLRFRIY